MDYSIEIDNSASILDEFLPIFSPESAIVNRVGRDSRAFPCNPVTHYVNSSSFRFFSPFFPLPNDVRVARVSHACAIYPREKYLPVK